MSGIFPNSPAPKTSDLTSEQPTLITIAESGKRQARNVGGHLWSVKFNYDKMTREKFEPINAFVMAQNGGLEEFQIVLPEKAEPLGVCSGSPLVAVAKLAGNTSIDVKGATPDITGIMKAGDIFKFEGNNKVHMCVSDANSSATGTFTISFMPELTSDVQLDAVIDWRNVPFTMYIDGANKYKTLSPMLHTYSLRLIESL